MKKLLKPEMEFIKFNAEDVITTSPGEASKLKGFEYDAVEDDTNKSLTENYSSGGNSLWNN